MDHFGIGAALRGVAHVYFQSARQTGRTSFLMESVKDGDRIVFRDGREAERFRRLCLERRVVVECIAISPNDPGRVLERHPAQGRTLFDHSWVEQFYLNAIERARREIDHLDDLTRAASCVCRDGHGQPLNRCDECPR